MNRLSRTNRVKWHVSVWLNSKPASSWRGLENLEARARAFLPLSPPLGQETSVCELSTATASRLSTPRGLAPPSTACVKWVQLRMCRNMCTPWCLFVVTGWTTGGWKWPVIWARSLGIYEALKCLVSGEGDWQLSHRQATGGERESQREGETGAMR